MTDPQHCCSMNGTCTSCNLHSLRCQHNVFAREAQAAGRKVRGFDEATWEEHREAIVTEGTRLKFSSSPELKAVLLSTGNRPLIEANHEDRIWGIGFYGLSAPSNREHWGQNLMGIALQAVRQELRDQQ